MIEGSRWLFVAMVLLGACTEKQSKRCEEICRIEAECTETLADPAVEFNRAECVEMCTELDKDDSGHRLVDKHAACVTAAGDDCAAVLRCD